MQLLSVNEIKKTYGNTDILNSVTFLIESGEKAAIVGVNGAGKTTLFKIIAGIESPDAGTISFAKNTNISYLTQEMALVSARTVYQEVLSVFDDLILIEQEIRKIEASFSSLSGNELEKAMHEYAGMMQSFEDRGGYRYKSSVRGVINGLKLGEQNLEDKLIHTLSGGQRTRVALAKLLLQQPDLLLLDEPTNHLDIASVTWLEGYLKDYPKSVIIISHDRYFIDRTVSKIIDLENGNSTIYHGTYQQFIITKQKERAINESHFINQQRMIKKQEEVIRTLRSYNREKSVKRAQSRQKMLDKLERIDKPAAEPSKMRIKLKPQKESGYDVLAVSHLAKSFGEKELFSDISFEIKKGERIAFLGANGTGKTTLLKMILGEMQPDAGEIKFGAGVKIGYYEQERASLNEQDTIFQAVSKDVHSVKDSTIRSILAAFLFRGDDVYKSIGQLSGGEKGRVYLSKIMVSGANFLLLDEPTNHLDMVSKEILEDALSSFEGTIFYISHDRYFINQTATGIISLDNGAIAFYPGNYDYYMEKKEKALSATENSEVSNQKSNWHVDKKRQSQKRKQAAAITHTEVEIEKTEQKIKDIEYEMSREEVYTDAQRAKEAFDLKETLQKELESLYQQWENLSLD